MKNKIFNILKIIGIIILVLWGLLFFFGCATAPVSSSMTERKELIEVRRDSIGIVFNPGIITDTTITIIANDTIISTNEVRFVFDTIIEKKYKNTTVYDTLKFEYDFATNEALFSSRTSLDSLFKVIQERTNTIVKERPWYELPLWGFGALIIGIVIGMVIHFVRKN